MTVIRPLHVQGQCEKEKKGATREREADCTASPAGSTELGHKVSWGFTCAWKNFICNFVNSFLNRHDIL